VFAQLRVWDTNRNTGVLLYVLLADWAIEIIADRAVAAHVDQAEWDAVCPSQASEYRNSTCDLTAPSHPATLGFEDSIT